MRIAGARGDHYAYGEFLTGWIDENLSGSDGPTRRRAGISEDIGERRSRVTGVIDVDRPSAPDEG